MSLTLVLIGMKRAHVSDVTRRPGGGTMQAHERHDMPLNDGMVTDTPDDAVDSEPPIDPSINAGRDAFGNVSDLGIRQEADEAEAGQERTS
jgi:hypothetical protein